MDGTHGSPARTPAVGDDYGATLERACRLVARNAEITAVHVVGGRRPTFDELWSLRIESEANGLRLHVDGAGRIDIARAEPVRTAPPAAPNRRPRRVPISEGWTAVERLRTSVAAWSFGFPSLTEGTR